MSATKRLVSHNWPGPLLLGIPTSRIAWCSLLPNRYLIIWITVAGVEHTTSVSILSILPWSKDFELALSSTAYTSWTASVCPYYVGVSKRRKRPSTVDPESSVIFRRGESGTTEELTSSSDTERSSQFFSSQSSEFRDIGHGKIVFLGVHFSLYQQKTAVDIVHHITRTCRTFRVRIVQVSETDTKELRGAVRELMDLEADDRWLRCQAEATGKCLDYFLQRAKATRDCFSLGPLVSKQDTDGNTPQLALHVPSGQVERDRQPVTSISAEISTKFSQIFDELPPISQILTKILSIATKQALFKLPKTVAWEVTNDLMVKGVDSKTFAIVLGEMKEMYLFKEEMDGGIEKLSFQSPALAEIALDVCTPSQVSRISEALIARLEPFLSHNFKVPLVTANLYLELGKDGSRVKALWRTGYRAFLNESEKWDPSERNWWLVAIADLVASAGYDPQKVFRKDGLEVPDMPVPVAPVAIRLLHSYVAPITFGPLGHTLSFITHTLSHLHGALWREDAQVSTVFQKRIRTACRLYGEQVNILENVLKDHCLPITEEEQRTESAMIEYFSSSNATARDVEHKAERFVHDFVKEFVVSRMNRLRSLATKLHQMKEPPDIISKIKEPAIVAAYQKLLNQGCWKDTTEDALMLLATRNWKPTLQPEIKMLPHMHQQNVCRIRDDVLKQTGEVSSGESSITLDHRHSHKDFACFLICTGILHGDST